jgi:hypothetical protein
MGIEARKALSLQVLSAKIENDVVVVTLLGFNGLHDDEPPVQTEQLPLFVLQLVQATLPAQVRGGRRAGVG